MRLTIFDALEVGLFQVPFYPNNPYLFFPFWFCFLLAIGIQHLLFRKCSSHGRWGFLIFSVIGLLICEIACQIITGWDLILWLILWFLFLTFLMGAGICTVYVFLKKKVNDNAS